MQSQTASELSFGGWPLRKPSAFWREWSERNLDLAREAVADAAVQCGPWLSHLPIPTTAQLTTVPFGTLAWPSGASRFTVGRFLVTEQDLAARPVANDRTNRERWWTDDGGGATPQKFVMDDGSERIEALLYALPPQPLSAVTAQDGGDQLYALTLVDERYWWWRKASYIKVDAGNDTGTEGDKADWGCQDAPLPGQSFPTVPESTDDMVCTGDPKTWRCLYKSVATGLGKAIKVLPIDCRFGRPSSRFDLHEAPIPPYLDALAWQVGQRIVRQLSGEVWAESAAYATDYTKNAFYSTAPQGQPPIPKRRLLAGGVFHARESFRVLPGTVRVLFGDRAFDGFFAQQGFAREILFSDVFPADLKVGAGTSNVKFVLVGDMTHDTTNVAKLSDCAKAYAESWYRWNLAFVDATFGGIVDFPPSGLCDRIEWTWVDGMERPTTRVFRPAWDTKVRGEFRNSSCRGFESAVWGCEDCVTASTSETACRQLEILECVSPIYGTLGGGGGGTRVPPPMKELIARSWKR